MGISGFNLRRRAAKAKEAANKLAPKAETAPEPKADDKVKSEPAPLPAARRGR